MSGSLMEGERVEGLDSSELCALADEDTYIYIYIECIHPYIF